MAFSLPVVFLACLAIAIAQYNPYSPHPPANARDPSLPSRSSSTYNRAQDFRAAGKNPGYRSSFTLPSKQGSYDQQGQLNGGSGYNGGSQRSSAYNGHQDVGLGYGSMGGQGLAPYNGGASGHAANSFGNGFQYGGSYDGSYDDMAQPSPDDPDGDSIVGVAGSDYPTYSEVPITSFECSQQQFPGLYADIEAQCQVFHICQDGGHHDSFLCPNGSIFNQQYFVCDWWYNVDCQSAPSFYGLNADLYKDVNGYSAAASYAANLPSGPHSFGNGQGPSADYSSRGQAQASAYGNGRPHSGASTNGIGNGRAFSGASSVYGNGNGRIHSGASSAYGNGNGNGRAHSGVASAYGNGRGPSGTSSAYGNGRGPAGTPLAYGIGNGRGNSASSAPYGNGRARSGPSSVYGNGNGSIRSGAASAYGNGIGRSGSSYGNGNGRVHSGVSLANGNGNGNGKVHSGATSAYGNGNGRGKVGSSSAYSNAISTSGPSSASQHAIKQLQNDDYSIADMPPLGY